MDRAWINPRALNPAVAASANRFLRHEHLPAAPLPKLLATLRAATDTTTRSTSMVQMLRSSSTMMPNAQLTRHSTKDTQLRMLVESELLLLLTTMIGVWLNNLLLKSQSGGVSEASGMV